MNQDRKIGVMLDCSRNMVMHLSGMKRFIDVLAKIGYNQLMLYTEDTYEIEGEPMFGYMRGRLTGEEIKTLDAYAAERGIELVPCIQTLAHLHQLSRWIPYIPTFDTKDTLLVDDERTYALIDKMFKACAENYTTRNIHIGMDEAHDMGFGEYFKKHGYQDKSEMFIRHLRKVCEIAEKYNFKPMIWSDMLFRIPYGQYEYYYENYCENEEVFQRLNEQIPQNLGLVYWDYDTVKQEKYDLMMNKHFAFNRPVTLASGAWKWKQFTPRNARSLNVIEQSCRAWNKHAFGDYLLTLWGDDCECPIYSVLPCLVYAAECCKGNYDVDNAKKRFTELFGEDFDDFMAFDLAMPDSLPKHTPDANGVKAQFYADVFGCAYDSTLTGDGIVRAEHAKYAKRFALAKEKSKDYRELFAFYEKLCSFMESKYELGYRTRVAYQNGDKEALTRLAEEYETAAERLRAFGEAYVNLWRKDHKAFGVEVMQHRVGGMLLRMEDCKKRLTAYLQGELACIEELEEKLVDYFTGGDEHRKCVPTAWRYATVVSANRFIY